MDDHLYIMDTDPIIFGTLASLMMLKKDIEHFLVYEEIGATPKVYTKINLF